MDNEVIVSVVIPCYNVEQYLRRGLDSLLAQTLQEWEAVLVDDGATDHTGLICDEYVEKDSRFRVIHTNNQGLPCARNNGMKEQLNGELLYYMDPDDKIEPNCFERCYETYREYQCDMIHFRFWWCYEGKEKFTKETGFLVSEGDDIINEYTCPLAGVSQWMLDRYYKGDNIWTLKKNGQVWSYMFKKSFVTDNNLWFSPGVTMNEDGFFLVEATYKARKIVQIPDVLYYYYQRENSIINLKKSREYYYEYKFRHIVEREIEETCQRV